MPVTGCRKRNACRPHLTTHLDPSSVMAVQDVNCVLVFKLLGQELTP